MYGGISVNGSEWGGRDDPLDDLWQYEHSTQTWTEIFPAAVGTSPNSGASTWPGDHLAYLLEPGILYSTGTSSWVSAMTSVQRQPRYHAKSTFKLHLNGNGTATWTKLRPGILYSTGTSSWAAVDTGTPSLQ